MPARSHGSLATALQCTPGTVSAKGAPFCYALPHGFTDNSTLTSYAPGWRYRTLVSVGKYDLVEVLAGRLPFDSGTYSDDKLRGYARVLLAEVVAQASRASASDVTPRPIAGVRGYEQTVRLRNGATEQSILAYRGHTEVYVQCERSDSVSAAQAGCARVLATIQVTAIPQWRYVSRCFGVLPPWLNTGSATSICLASASGSVAGPSNDRVTLACARAAATRT